MFLRENAAEHFAGCSVLDYGCGKQPYREIVEQAGGDYEGYDQPFFPGSTVQEPVGTRQSGYDTIICTQVIQYVDGTQYFLEELWDYLSDMRGTLLMTGPTNWPIVEEDDLYRFTPNGIRELLAPTLLWANIEVGERAHVEFEGERWPIGWWAKAKAVRSPE